MKKSQNIRKDDYIVFQNFFAIFTMYHLISGSQMIVLTS